MQTTLWKLMEIPYRIKISANTLHYIACSNLSYCSRKNPSILHFPTHDIQHFIHSCNLTLLSSEMPLFLHEAMACPPNSNYSLCASSCPETCLHVAEEPGCEEQCVEGCVCNPGFVLSNDKCVPREDCGCVDDKGFYHPVSGNSLRLS